MFAIKRELKLNKRQRTLVAKHAGFARVVYNYGLSLYNQLDHKQYKGGVTKKIGAIKKVLTNYTKGKPELAWMKQLSSKVYQSALQDLQSAFYRFFNGLGKYPVFKKKKDTSSFTVYDGNGVVLLAAGKKIKMPSLGTFRLKESLDARYVTQTFTISRKGDRQKTTTEISRKYATIRIEDLNVSGMMANQKLSAAISDMGFYEFRRQLVYKQSHYGTKVELVDRWYPSSKTCSCCGHIQPIPLTERVFECQRCSVEIDRDLNASINLENAPDNKVGMACPELNACGLVGADTPERNRK